MMKITYALIPAFLFVAACSSSDSETKKAIDSTRTDELRRELTKKYEGQGAKLKAVLQLVSASEHVLMESKQLGLAGEQIKASSCLAQNFTPEETAEIYKKVYKSVYNTEAKLRAFIDFNENLTGKTLNRYKESGAVCE